jgi:hypothetical protein
MASHTSVDSSNGERFPWLGAALVALGILSGVMVYVSETMAPRATLTSSSTPNN